MLKKSVKKELSILFAITLILSMLLPVIAAAAPPTVTATYDKSTGAVTASVYSDVYDSTYGGVTLNVYSPNGSIIDTITKATYDGYGTNTGVPYWYYQFSKSVTANTYDYLKLIPSYNNVSGSVYCAVYNGANVCPSTPTPGGPGSGGYVGGGGGINNDTITAGSDGKVDAGVLSSALKNYSHVTITITGDSAYLPASALLDAKSGAILTISNGRNSYDLPVSALKLSELAKNLGISVNDMTIQVMIKVLTGDAAKPIQNAVQAISGASQVADIVDFQVNAVGKDGKTIAVDFGNLYVSRNMGLSKVVDWKKTTGVIYQPETGKLSFVPTIISSDGKMSTLKRNGSSIYTVIELTGLSFKDITSHWAKADIELLANKLVVDGQTDTTFEPELSITRAEFATLAVRALGLTIDPTGVSSFSDVSKTAWYNTVVAAATKAGLVEGYEDGTFRPEGLITREELAALMVRSMKYAGYDASVTSTEQTTLLSPYTDTNRIIWGRAEIAAAIKAGLINGMTDTTLATDQSATRAQSAVMLKRFLQKVTFIN